MKGAKYQLGGCTWSRPGIISWDKMTGLSLRLGLHWSQYSLASTFTFLWSRPSWQMSACIEDAHMGTACYMTTYADGIMQTVTAGT